ncbi:type II toxin-antitoxin system antitoxin SocA domain-containing protein [Salinivirga cyanobacteriivorans]
MKSPFTGKEMKIVKEWRTMSFRKNSFDVLFHAYECEDTGEQFEDDALANLNYNQLVNQYRVKYRIPFPEQIIAIRNKYGVSATKMSEILGFGVNSYRQYESGEVPSQSNARLIQLVDDPHEFKKLVDLSSTLETNAIQKIHKNIKKQLEARKENKQEKYLERYFFSTYLPTSFTGYKKPDLNKFAGMVVFFAEQLAPWKTKLNKLLFYTDFLMYKRTGFSMSGIQYRAIPMGPVPNKFNSIFEYLDNKEEVDIHFTNFTNGGTGEQFKPAAYKKFNKELFSEFELSILSEVAMRFEKTTTDEMIDISHKEKAWLENKEEKKLIDYKYSFELNQV